MIGGALKGHQFATLLLLKMQLVDFDFFYFSYYVFFFLYIVKASNVLATYLLEHVLNLGLQRLVMLVIIMV